MDKEFTFLDEEFQINKEVNSDSIWTRTFILGCLDKIKRHLLKAPGCGGLAGTKRGHNSSFTASSSKTESSISGIVMFLNAFKRRREIPKIFWTSFTAVKTFSMVFVFAEEDNKRTGTRP
ncbi:hypothetical protein Pyn_27713 [Prunus yedoensis var. nudiflora]|uniref:Uncharacterized protein n=1 Tax=Prunus yedoensis var. nudiflora TaxID=2094558 RepID=A0A314U845_PRUYE|nr:hypothetical protein Pyn_26092 [Prunus yedoensis var. nudiflora]PQM33748.1 hypothetical protein Pyn_27713 [Prunus yedoensis var. nudiflora]